jgi:hypothetical protein
MSDRLTDRLVSPPARASARKRANADHETRRETTPRHPRQDARPPPTMSAEQRAKARAAGAEDARRSRIRQGLPERIEDPAAIAILAALLRTEKLRKPEAGSNHDRKPSA